MSLRRPISPEIRDQLADDPFMRVCCITDENCYGALQWHHAVTHAGQRLDAAWAILPACEWHHSRAYQRRTSEAFATIAKRRKLALDNKLASVVPD